jgi:NAD(P)-dependent dehydrogenase (short-subunit alcohol dehydrogenase family)
MASRQPLENRSALITGGSRGIGFACAQALAAAGARVFLVARNEAPLRAAAARIGPSATPVVCDVSRRDDLDRALGAVRETLGGAPDILVNNAARFAPMPAARMPVDEFEATLRVNLVPYFAVVRVFLDDFLAKGAGHIVSIGSIADRVAFADNAAYSASKFGARGLHEVLRRELRGTGVRVTLISPGPTDTPIWDPVDPGTRVGHTPREQMLDAGSVADAVLFAVTRPPQANIDELRLSRS